MTEHPIIGRIIEREDGKALGVVGHIYNTDENWYPWALIVREDGTFIRASLGPNSGVRMRVKTTSNNS
jgi:hypothetical protein